MTTKSTDSASRLTAKEYASLHMKVPNSGTEWLDQMVIEARRLDAEQFQAKLKEPAKATKSKPQGPKDPPAGGAGTKIG